MSRSVAKFAIGQIIRHRSYEVRGVVFDVDPEFCESERWRGAIDVDAQLLKDQPFYYLLDNSEEQPFIAYVPEQSLVADFRMSRCFIRRSASFSTATTAAAIAFAAG
jgi:heat shock protein HspQ